MKVLDIYAVYYKLGNSYIAYPSDSDIQGVVHYMGKQNNPHLQLYIK